MAAMSCHVMKCSVSGIHRWLTKKVAPKPSFCRGGPTKRKGLLTAPSNVRTTSLLAAVSAVSRAADAARNVRRLIFIPESELQPQPELDDPRRLRALDLPKERTRHVHVRRVESHLIQGIEELGAKLQCNALGDAEIFE